MNKKIIATFFIILFIIINLIGVTSNAVTKKRPWDYIRFNTIAYSRIDENDAPINTAEHFMICGRMQCYTSLKADVRITKDYGLVLCHDEGFTLNEEGKIIDFDPKNQVLISNLSTEECLSLEHANYNESEWQFKVTDFETYIMICKRCGKIPFITVRDQSIDTTVEQMLPILEKYDLIDKCIINSFTTETLIRFRKANKDIMLSKVLNKFEKLTKEVIDWAIEMDNCLITLYDLPEADLNQIEENKEMILYANNNNVMIYEAISTFDNAEELISIGIQGGQFTVPVEDTVYYRNIIVGDINEDGQITVADLFLFKKLLINTYMTEYQNIIRGDLNEDKKISITDLLLIKRKIVYGN